MAALKSKVSRRKEWHVGHLHGSDSLDTSPVHLITPSDNYPANLVSSLLDTPDSEFHAPALDIDIPCRYVPSSTEGHGHLYFDSLRLDWYNYRKLLDALAEAGIISKAYRDHSVRQKQTLLRIRPDKYESKAA